MFFVDLGYDEYFMLGLFKFLREKNSIQIWKTIFFELPKSVFSHIHLHKLCMKCYSYPKSTTIDGLDQKTCKRHSPASMQEV